MNWEAMVAIGLFTLILGVVLLVPALWWARRKSARTSPKARASDFLAAAIVVTVLLALVTLHQFYPDHPVVWWAWRSLWLVVLPLLLWHAHIVKSRTRR
jgi:hypothetical protein